MSNWSLVKLLSGLHDDIEARLAIARKTLDHPVAKGDASEAIWLELLQTYLPQRYRAAKALVVDTPQGKPATAFLFELIARLQACATVPMIDIRAYAKWLAD